MAERPMAAIYARLSEEDRVKNNGQNNSSSIINQVMLLRQYAEQDGLGCMNAIRMMTGRGADRSRPAFNRLLRDAEQAGLTLSYANPESFYSRTGDG